MNPFKLLNPSYLFDPTPGVDFLYDWPLFIIMALLFAASFKVDRLLHQHKDYKQLRSVLGGIPARMREFAFLSLVWTFFRWQNLPYLSARIIFILLILAYVTYAFSVWKGYKTALKEGKTKTKAQVEEDKYLPKTKKKRR